MVLSNGCGRVSFLSGMSGGLIGLVLRLASLALALWCALVRHAVLCCALPCCAALFRAALRCAPLCRALLCRVVLCCALWSRGGLRLAVPLPHCAAVPCRGVQYRVALHGGLLCCLVPCCIVFCCALLRRGLWWVNCTSGPAPSGVGAG